MCKSCHWNLSTPSLVAVPLASQSVSLRLCARAVAHVGSRFGVRCAGRYEYGPTGSNDCPRGTDRIIASFACLSAATFLGRTYSGPIADHASQSGCHWNNDTQSLWFNEIPVSNTGFANDRGRLLCQATPTPAPTIVGSTIPPMTRAPTAAHNWAGGKGPLHFVPARVHPAPCPQA